MFSFFENRINPFPDRDATSPPSGFIAFCWHYTKDAWVWILAMSALGAFIAIVEVTLFGFMGSLVDLLSNSDRAGFFEREGTRLLWMGLLLVIVLPIAEITHSMILHQTLLGNYPMISRWMMHRHLLGQSMNFFANEFSGRIATKLMQTSMGVRESVLIVMDILVYVAVYFTAMFILISQSNLLMVIPLGFWLLTYVGLISYFVPKLKTASKNQADARSTMTGRIVDSYTNITTMKLFSHTGREAVYAHESMDGFLQTVHIQMRLVTLFNFFIGLNNVFIVFSIASMAIWLWLQQSITIGAIAIAIALALRINGMSHWIMWQVSALFEHIGVVHDGMAMLNKPVDVIDNEKPGKLIVPHGAVVFDNIRFNYGQDTAVIENLNLKIAPGEKIGLVGRSGAGKTTLTNILLRFYDLEAGEIRVDGTDISTVTQDSLRAQIGVVTQDTSLLHRSIRENIAYSRPDASEDEVIAAAKRANAWEFIETLEDQRGRIGLDAQVGERGVKLSGGQRQRIAIARIFLKDAPILVLDEATSALDSEVEAAIQENLFSLMKGKTVIAIAHRLSTISELDRLIVMDKGAIVESGTHDELVGQGGIYADLWKRQSGGFIVKPGMEG